ncbi:hypothetical protein GJ496_004298, partial [Pomphorhynchus laevis]
GEKLSDNNLNKQLWKISNDLRGTMDASEFKNYILGFIFYKHLSEKVQLRVDELLKNESINNFSDAMEHEGYKKALKSDCIDNLGYFIEPAYLFSTIIESANKKEFILDNLGESFNQILSSTIGEDSEEDFNGLFDDIDLTNNKIGANPQERNETICKIMLSLYDVKYDTNKDILGDAYEYLLKEFASSAGKKGGEFYTPSEVSEVVAKLVCIGKTKVLDVYDPTCGSGSLLLKARGEMKGNISYIYGQELNTTTYNLCRMNMFLHGVKYNDFQIKQGNTLNNDKFDNQQFELIVANPPFGTKWDGEESKLLDLRFKPYGKLAPKSKGEFAFLQHMLYHLKDNGTMASVVPHGVLFRGAAELHIRKHMIEQDNCLDAVIGLPSNLFYGTGIPACILVFKKNREHKDNILFIDASNDFEKVKTQNVLKEEHINKIIDTYTKRISIEKYSNVVPLSQIIENEYNLNIPRYVDTFEEEEIIDIDEVMDKLEELQKEQEELKKLINVDLKELGLRELK